MRTMTVHAMSPSERAELDTLVTTMVSYGARRSRLACGFGRVTLLTLAGRAHRLELHCPQRH
jgi:hypothetical protein